MVEVEEVFFQCAKAFRRSRHWDPASWPAPALQPPLARVLKDQVPSCEQTFEQLDSMIREGYQKRLF